MRETMLAMFLATGLAAAAGCGKKDEAAPAAAAPAADGKKTCDDVGKNFNRIHGNPQIEGQTNGYTEFCRQNHLTQTDIDCMANARDQNELDACRDRSGK